MGDVLIKQQSTADAVRAYERSAEAYSRGHSQVGGVRPNEMTESWAKLARALKATGRVADAETAYRKSIELWQAKLLDPYDGFDPADVFAPLLDELAALLEAQNRASEALDLRKRANAFRSLPRQTRPAVHREGITVHQPPKHP
jgi:tetratricopeptide (TPR) repeat protein